VEELKPCPNCGKEVEMKCTFGGPVVYYGIYCSCGFNNRNYLSGALISHGLNSSSNFPPDDREKAINDWNSLDRKI